MTVSLAKGLFELETLGSGVFLLFLLQLLQLSNKHGTGETLGLRVDKGIHFIVNLSFTGISEG